jgi:hypothetical protein
MLKQVGDTRWLSWFRRRAVSRRVVGLFPSGVIGIFNLLNPSGRTMALGSTHPLTGMLTAISPGVKGGRCLGLKPLYADCLEILGALNC